MVVTLTIGDSTSGYSRTGRRVKEMTPNSRIATLITVASTGRWIEISLSFIVRLLSALGAAGLRIAAGLRGAARTARSRTRGAARAAHHARRDRNHLGSVEQLLVARLNHAVPG